MKKLYYAFGDEELNQNHEKYIDLILQEATPKSSNWFSGIPGLANSSEKLLNYFSDIKKRYFLGDESAVNLLENHATTAKFCPAFPALFSRIHLIKTPVDIHLSISSDGNFYWNAPVNYGPPLIQISNHPAMQYTSSKSNLFTNMVNIKFMLSLEVGTEKEVPFMFLPPMYHNDISWTVLQGIIQKEHTNSQPLNVNTMFNIPKQGTEEHYIQAGTVLAYLFTMEPTKLEMNSRLRLPKYKTKFLSKYFYPK